MSQLFDPTVRTRIEAAVKAAESTTAAEIVVGIVKRSSSYGEWRALGAAALCFSISFGVFLAFHDIPAGDIFFAQPFLALACWALCGIPPILRLLAPDGREIRAVEDRARSMFVEAGIHSAKTRFGVLILISALERRVQILFDTGVSQAVPTPFFKTQADAISQAIAKGAAGDGLCAAIEAIGRELAVHHPRSSADVNELPDHVRS